MSSVGRDSSPPTAEAKADRRNQPPTLVERLRSLFGLGGASVRDDIEDLIEENDTDVFSPQERAMLRNVLNLHEIRVDDIMVPRADIIAIGLDARLSAVLTLFREAGHSRLPVHGETLDEPKGMVHIRDFVHYITDPSGAGDQIGGTIHIDMGQTLEASKVMRPVLFVPPSMQAIDLLVRMQSTRTHMALVIDEFGGTDGLVTIEDIVEMIVGDIEDEHDEDERPKIVPEAEGSFLADARATLEDVAAAFGAPVATEEEAEDVETLGGLVTSLAGHVPSDGEIVRGNGGADFEIVESDPRRVIQVRLRRKQAADAAADLQPAATETALRPE